MKIRRYRDSVLLVVLFGYKTWSVTPGDEHRLRDFENGIMRNISGHNVGGACVTCGGEEKSYKDVVEKSEVKKSLGRPELRR
jgi:hypothetical protein